MAVCASFSTSHARRCWSLRAWLSFCPRLSQLACPLIPEWRGVAIGMRFLNAVCDRWRRGLNRYGRPMPTLFHTSHPGVAAALRRDPLWCQVSARLYGENKKRCAESQRRSHERGKGDAIGAGTGHGGHFRAVQGFRYMGD